MLKFAAERLSSLPGVEFVELWGNDLRPISDNSIDFVYSTVVFMHLESWDRYGYVREAFRVLRPGGKLYVDTVNLLPPGLGDFRDAFQVPALPTP